MYWTFVKFINRIGLHYRMFRTIYLYLLNHVFFRFLLHLSGSSVGFTKDSLPHNVYSVLTFGSLGY